MDEIKATWTDGKIVPAQPVDWPEGSQLLVKAIDVNGERIGLTEEEWGDDSESIAAWIAAVEKIEPLVWAEGEREAFESYREASRQFNFQAVRNQMNDLPGGGSA